MLTSSGDVTRVRIAAAGVDSRIIPVELRDGVDGLRWDVADYAVGHHAGSGLPGEGRSVVLAGHNNTRGEVFRHLDRLRQGDVGQVRSADGVWHRYSVTQTHTVLDEGAPAAQRQRNARLLADTGQERLLLVTCWPYRPDPPYRLVVVATPIEA